MKKEAPEITHHSPIILGKWMIKIRHFRFESNSIYRKRNQGYAFSLQRKGRLKDWTQCQEKGYQLYCNFPPMEGLPSYTSALSTAIKQLDRVRIYHPTLY